MRKIVVNVTNYVKSIYTQQCVKSCEAVEAMTLSEYEEYLLKSRRANNTENMWWLASRIITFVSDGHDLH